MTGTGFSRPTANHALHPSKINLCALPQSRTCLMRKPSFHLPRPAPLLRDLPNLRNEGVLRLLAQAILVGGGSGLVIGLFRKIYDWNTLALTRFFTSGGLGEATPWVIFGGLILLALIVALILRFEPGISGSGIPQVELALSGRIPFPWLRLVIAKFIGTLLSLTGGLSVGREGPSIQMGAAVGCGFGQLFHHRSGTEEATRPRFLIAGSVAGLTAAFGAPVAGMLFAFEEVKALVSVPLLLFTGAAAASAWLTIQLLGFGLVFPFEHIASLPWEKLWIAIPVGLGAGVFSAGYNLLLIQLTLLHDRQRLVPTFFRPLFPFLLAGVLLYTYPQVMAGVGISAADLAGLTPRGVLPLLPLVLLLAVKILFSVLSFASGVPGGILMPMLAIGGMAGALAGTGFLEAGLVSSSTFPVFLVLGMTGLFAGTVRAPLTGIALVAEMSGAYTCLPEMIITGILAAFAANLLKSPPVYDSLKKRILRNHNAQKKNI